MMLREILDRVALWIAVLTITMFLVFSAIWAFAEEGMTCESQVHSSIQSLQPWYYRTSDLIALSRRNEQLFKLTNAICNESSKTGVNSLIAVSIAFRESSLHPNVGKGIKNGLRGERGYFQIMPNGTAESFAPGDCSQHDPDCNATTAFGFMRHLKSICGDDPWVWVAAYGGRGDPCPTREEAREYPEVRVARSYLCKIGDCDSIWPE
jgi:hypothetical protein